ncbi:hypothetical protein NDU88_006761 [Pleurodeles waltl]|uniref:Uncharacterized protein n=1 Tax=Pleurodeles waltl TaxID=8319 RepID=A0AAV7WEI2_PLEWA|nr:hypothetical protein NDU88_006761 [Pleurodeles waltl]
MESIGRGVVSCTYKMINNNMPDTMAALRATLKQDLGELDDLEWEAALMHSRKVTTKARLRLIQFKILHRIYYIRQNLHQMGGPFTTMPAMCDAQWLLPAHTLGQSHNPNTLEQDNLRFVCDTGDDNPSRPEVRIARHPKRCRHPTK